MPMHSLSNGGDLRMACVRRECCAYCRWHTHATAVSQRHGVGADATGCTARQLSSRAAASAAGRFIVPGVCGMRLLAALCRTQRSEGHEALGVWLADDSARTLCCQNTVSGRVQRRAEHAKGAPPRDSIMAASEVTLWGLHPLFWVSCPAFCSLAWLTHSSASHATD